jgi:hypothetical protein
MYISLSALLLWNEIMRKRASSFFASYLRLRNKDSSIPVEIDIDHDVAFKLIKSLRLLRRHVQNHNTV